MASQTQLTHRQHKVPQWHLRNFADANGDLWCYGRNTRPRPRKPKSVCWEPDFYEYELNGYKTQNEYERWLGQIENDSAAKCQDILSCKQFGQWDATVWATYVASLFVRSTKCREQIHCAMMSRFKEESRSTEFVRNLQHELLKKGHLLSASDIGGIVESRRTEMETSRSYYHLAGMKNASCSLAQSLINKTWHTLETPSGVSFLLGDCPVMTIGFNGSQLVHGGGFNNESTVAVLPLTPHHLFVASPPTREWKAVLEPHQVAIINALTVRYARDVVLSNVNDPRTQNLVNTEINKVVFGCDAFIAPN